MPATYTITQVKPLDVDRVYPLIEPVASTLDLAAWRRYCTQLASRTDLVVQGEQAWIALNPIGVIQGLSLCRLSEDFSHNRMLEVPIFVVASAADDVGVSKALLDQLRDRAKNAECTSIRIWTPASDNWSRRLRPLDYSRWDNGIQMILQ